MTIPEVVARDLPSLQIDHRNGRSLKMKVIKAKDRGILLRREDGR